MILRRFDISIYFCSFKSPKLCLALWGIELAKEKDEPDHFIVLERLLRLAKIKADAGAG